MIGLPSAAGVEVVRISWMESGNWGTANGYVLCVEAGWEVVVELSSSSLARFWLGGWKKVSRVRFWTMVVLLGMNVYRVRCGL